MKKTLTVLLLVLLFISCDTLEPDEEEPFSYAVSHGTINIYNVDPAKPLVGIKFILSGGTPIMDDTVNLQPGKSLSKTVPVGKYYVQEWYYYDDINVYVYENETTELNWTFNTGFYER